MPLIILVIISNVLVILMGVLVFILSANVKKVFSKIDETEKISYDDSGIKNNINVLEVKMDSFFKKFDQGSFDKIMDLRREFNVELENLTEIKRKIEKLELTQNKAVEKEALAENMNQIKILAGDINKLKESHDELSDYTYAKLKDSEKQDYGNIIHELSTKIYEKIDELKFDNKKYQSEFETLRGSINKNQDFLDASINGLKEKMASLSKLDAGKISSTLEQIEKRLQVLEKSSDRNMDFIEENIGQLKKELENLKHKK